MDLTGFRDDDLYGTADQTYQGTLVHVEDQTEGAIQVNGHADEVLQAENCTLTQHYGFSSHPPKDTELVLQPLESGAVVSVAENVDRPDLSTEGQVRLWDKNDNYVDLKPNDEIRINQENGNFQRFIGGAGVRIHAEAGGTIALVDTYTAIGSLTAAEGILKGTSHNAAWIAYLTVYNAYVTAYNTFLGGWSSALTQLQSTGNAIVYAGAMLAILPALQTAVTNLQAALTTLQAALPGTVSTKNFIDA